MENEVESFITTQKWHMKFTTPLKRQKSHVFNSRGKNAKFDISWNLVIFVFRRHCTLGPQLCQNLALVHLLDRLRPMSLDKAVHRASQTFCKALKWSTCVTLMTLQRLTLLLCFLSAACFANTWCNAATQVKSTGGWCSGTLILALSVYPQAHLTKMSCTCALLVQVVDGHDRHILLWKKTGSSL